MYELITADAPFAQEVIKRTNADGSESFIPKDPANSDYQRYLRWLNGEEENGTIGQSLTMRYTNETLANPSLSGSTSKWDMSAIALSAKSLLRLVRELIARAKSPAALCASSIVIVRLYHNGTISQEYGW